MAAPPPPATRDEASEVRVPGGRGRAVPSRRRDRQFLVTPHFYPY